MYTFQSYPYNHEKRGAHLEGGIGDRVVPADDDDAVAAGEDVANPGRDLVDSLCDAR